MRERTVKRYYCDHCKKANLSRFHMAKHEDSCTKNPNRICKFHKFSSEGERALQVKQMRILAERVILSAMAAAPDTSAEDTPKQPSTAHEPGMGWKLSNEARWKIDQIQQQNVRNAAKAGSAVLRGAASDTNADLEWLDNHLFYRRKRIGTWLSKDGQYEARLCGDLVGTFASFIDAERALESAAKSWLGVG